MLYQQGRLTTQTLTGSVPSVPANCDAKESAMILWSFPLHFGKPSQCLPVTSSIQEGAEKQTCRLCSSCTCTPSSSSSSAGEGGGDFTSTSSLTDNSLFLFESFLAALAPPSDSTFLLLGKEERKVRSNDLKKKKSQNNTSQC